MPTSKVIAVLKLFFCPRSEPFLKTQELIKQARLRTSAQKIK